ncbi:MAG: hypothetical protein VCB59_00760 [Gammaproteobacteria bacterium]
MTHKADPNVCRFLNFVMPASYHTWVAQPAHNTNHSDLGLTPDERPDEPVSKIDRLGNFP